MAVTLVGISTAFPNATTLSLDPPSGVQAGDLLLVNAGGDYNGTVPTGWTRLPTNDWRCGFYRFATSSNESAFVVSVAAGGTTYGAGPVMVAYRGVAPVYVRGQATQANILTVPAWTPTTNTLTIGLSTTAAPVEGGVYPSGTTSGWPTIRHSGTLISTHARIFLGEALEASGVAQPQRSLGNADFGGQKGTLKVFITVVENVAPNAPLLLVPNNTALNKDATNRLSWQYSDDNPSDSQSSYDLRYRVVGAPSWTTVSASTPNTYRDFPAGTFSTASYEWQVRTYDNSGAQGPYSSSGFFSAASPPAGPAITAPINGSTQGLASVLVTWAVTDQDAYRVRSYADNAGVIDTSSMLYDSGELTSSSVRSAVVPLPVNSRYEHLTVEVKDNGLWSPAASVRILVSYTTPAAPLLSVLPVQTVPSAYVFTDALQVTTVNPAPTGGQPSVSYLTLERGTVTDAGVVLDEWRRSLLPAGIHLDRTAEHGVEKAYRATAHATNGTTSTSDWVADARDLSEADQGDYVDASYDPAHYD